MTILHIEGFDAVNTSTKAGYVNISNQGQTTVTTHGYLVTPGELATYAASGKHVHATSKSLQLNFEHHTGREYDDEANSYLDYPGNHGTWNRIPFACGQQSLKSFVFGFNFKTSAINSSYSTAIAAIADNNGNPLMLLGYNTSGYLVAWVLNSTHATYSKMFRPTYAPTNTTTTITSGYYKGRYKQRNFIQNTFIESDGIGTSPAGTGSTAIVADTWHHIEVKVTENSSKNYTVQVVLDDTTEFTTSALAVSNNQCANLSEVILIHALTATYTFNVAQMAEVQHYFDDLYLLDTAGSNNNDLLGSSMRVEYLPISGQSSDFQQFTADTGTPSGNLLSFDTTSLAELVNPGSGLFTIADPSGITQARGIRYVTQSKYATGATDIDFLIKTNNSYYNASGVVHSGSPITLTTSNSTYQEIQELNPNTSAFYTESELDALQIGLRTS